MVSPSAWMKKQVLGPRLAPCASSCQEAMPLMWMPAAGARAPASRMRTGLPFTLLTSVWSAWLAHGDGIGGDAAHGVAGFAS